MGQALGSAVKKGGQAARQGPGQGGYILELASNNAV